VRQANIDMASKAIVGEKVGMTQVWDGQNRAVPVTVVRVPPVRVVQVKTTERDGYSALQVTFGTVKPSRLTKPQAGVFAKAGVEPGRRLVELRLDSSDGYTVGQELTVGLLVAGEKIDVTAVSRIRRQVPVADYLRTQARFRHLFGRPGHPEVVERLQRQADRTITRYGLLADGAR